ncbi:hypothetical protein V6N11_028320 [Hibiscus sabdariffa]|uniref:Uncharacterized protein n=1 Tax=Hibiscus sabdariffa TaxID=183260 RepID=A0ABR2NQS3_9ROSI
MHHKHNNSSSLSLSFENKMAKIASVALSLAVVLSILFVARGTAQSPEEKAFHSGVEMALVQMEEFGIFHKDMKSELGKVNFHQAFVDAKAKENNAKAIFVVTFINTMAMLEKSGVVDRSVYDKLFPGGGKTLTPELELALAHAFEEARQLEHRGGHPKHDL